MNLAFQAVLACGQCTVDRMMPSWVAFSFIRLAMICFVGWTAVDTVRVLGLFVAYEVLYLWLWRTAILSSVPFPLNPVAVAILLILEFGLPAALLLKYASRHSYFRRPGRTELSWKRCLCVIPLAITITAIQASYVIR